MKDTSGIPAIKELQTHLVDSNVAVAGNLFEEVEEAQRSCELLVPQLEGWKNEGNQAYGAGDYTAALKAYQRGIALARDDIYASEAHWKACKTPGSRICYVFDLVGTVLKQLVCSWPASKRSW